MNDNTIKQVRARKGPPVERMRAARTDLLSDDCRDLALEIFRADLGAELDRHVTAHRQALVAAVENWWDKYWVTLHDLQSNRESVTSQLDRSLRTLGYVRS